METNIINVGNSKGIIIPAKFLKIFGFENVVNVEVEEGKLVISKSKKPRDGWDEIIKKEIEINGNSALLAPDFFEDEDNSDWQW